MPHRDNPYVFVVGCPRSGTTLLQRMLDNHPRLAVANDTHFIARCLEKHARESIPMVLRGEPLPLTAELAGAVRSYRRFSRLGVDDEQVQAAAQASSTYSEFVTALYSAFAARHGKPLGGEKTPDFVRRLPLLHALFPQARSVHIIRDGRDVALSAMDWANEKKGPGRMELWRTEPLAVAALWWRRQVSAGRESGGRLGAASYLELRYEELVADPETELCRITDFLGLPFSDRMPRFHDGKRKPGAGLSAKSAWLPATQGLRDWRSQMSERDTALFEALAGDLLDELGLERMHRTISASISALAETCTAAFEAEHGRREAKARRRNRQPEGEAMYQGDGRRLS